MWKRFVLALLLCASAQADVVTDWSSAALDAVRSAKTPPPVASRALAILHISMYDAIQGIARTHEVILVSSRAPASASREAAASAAAHAALIALFPAQAADFDALHTAILGRIPDGAQKTAGIAWGETVASEVLLRRANDGFDAVVPVPAASGPGAWQKTPPQFLDYLLPQWGFVRPFGIPNVAAYRPAPPPALAGAVWAADYDEVKALGGAVGSARTVEQSTIALFWADGAGTETPPGHWNHIARDVASARGNSVEQNARLFALLNIAMADAAICAWDAKYTYMFWRPVTAIRNGDSDGNSATTGDPNWISYIGTPPFPDYVSGHSTFSGAAARVLALFYGTDAIPFTTGSDFLPGTVRSFPSFSAAAGEAAVSRLYGGIHFRSANEAGLQAGLAIGQHVYERMARAHRKRRAS